MRDVRLDALPRTIAISHSSDGASVSYIDQTKLPRELAYQTTSSWRELVDAVSALAVRGAPALGVAGAAAFALWSAREGRSFDDPAVWLARATQVADAIATARPTAVNLSRETYRAFDLAVSLLNNHAPLSTLPDALVEHTRALELEDERVNRCIGAFGADLLPQGARVLTHCNAGSLATAFFGTALGVVYEAAVQGKIERVFADETRPVGQGARLTSWELSRAGVPVTVICDNMAASLMARGDVDAVIVGADRIAANGDVANKIGTYGVAVLAHAHGIPMYVAAPTSTVDLSLPNGECIEIEQRDPSEVMSWIPEGVDIWNPAFDVTPASLIDSIVTERGVFSPSDIAQAVQGEELRCR